VAGVCPEAAEIAIPLIFEEAGTRKLVQDHLDHVRGGERDACMETCQCVSILAVILPV
jgi:hypothetical protein